MEICKIKRMELVAVDSEKKQKEIQNYIESFNYKERNNYPKIKKKFSKKIMKILIRFQQLARGYMDIWK